MNTRERFQAVMNFRPFDRLPVVEWASWWNLTFENWRTAGHFPADWTHGAKRYDIVRHFGLDLYMQDWIRPFAPGCPKPAAHGAGLIQSRADYLKLKPHLFGFDHIDFKAWEQRARLQTAGDAVLWFTLDGFFWFPRVLFGIEQHLYAFFDQPELMRELNDDLCAWSLEVIRKLGDICAPDFMTLAEDMSYNHGAMISPELFAAFITPYYQRLVPELHRLGTLAVIDSDGDITEPIGWFATAGLDGALPLERQSGVDLDVLRRRYPRQRFIGGFDKLVMHRGEAAIRAEFERLLPVAARGGCILSCDHQTPPAVSYADYQLYLRLFREYADRAGALSRLP
jgi:hypothetical protein